MQACSGWCVDWLKTRSAFDEQFSPRDHSKSADSVRTSYKITEALQGNSRSRRRMRSERLDVQVEQFLDNRLKLSGGASQYR
jgi:hypothetical protein